MPLVSCSGCEGCAAVLLLPVPGTAAVGPEQLCSLVSAGAVIWPCLLQGRCLLVEMRCRALHSSGHQVLHLGSAGTFGSAWLGWSGCEG